ncbi:UNVERIFIED_CONTAM: hypothetical protein FKN15_069725 [Acipenser sinensis]
MADPGMMSLFGDDGNLFSEGLEGLGECGFPESQVNTLGPPMPIDQGYGSLPSSLHHLPQPPPGQGQPKLSHFDHFGQYEQQKMHLMEQQGGRMLSNAAGNGMSSPHSQYHNPPPPVSHGGGGQMGVYPGLQGERHGQPFVDSVSLWGPRAVQVPEQVRAPFQQQPPQQSAPSGHVQQMGAYMARGDYSMQPHSQTPTLPGINQFSQGPQQEGGRGPQANHFLGHMSPQQNPNLVGPPMRHPVQQQQPQQFHHRPTQGNLHPESVAHTPRFSPSSSQQQAVVAGRPQQSLSFNSRNQTVQSPTVNNSGQYSPYSPYSNLSQGLVNNTGMSPNIGLTSNNTPMTQGRYPNTASFPPGTSQGLMHPQSIQVNQINSQPMHPSQQPQPAQQQQPQGSYGSPPPMSPMKALCNPAGTPPPQQVRPGSAGMVIEVGGYPSMPHQPPGAIGLAQRNIGPRGLQQQPPPPQPYMGLSPSHRDMAGGLRPPGGIGGNHAEPPGIQELRLLIGPPQQHPGQPLPPPLVFQKQQLPTCPSMQQQPHLIMHHQNSPPLQSHHQPWAQQHKSSPTPQKVPVQQPSPSDLSVEMPASDMMQVSSQNSQLVNCEEQQTDLEQKQQKKKKKKANRASSGEITKDTGEETFQEGLDPLKSPETAEKKKKKKPKEKKEPKEPKTPKMPKTPKTPKVPKEKKVKVTTPKPKSTKKASNKPNPETSTTKKKEGKRKRESLDNSDLERTPPPSPEEEEDDMGIQKRRSSRQVKRKRYTEEFKISDDEVEDVDDATGRKSPSNTSQSEPQEVPDDGPVVEKIMSVRMGKKLMESGEEVEVEEFYVKFKHFSYLHCRWADLEELEKDKRIHQKIKRFRAKQTLKFLSEMEDEHFNPDYVEVDRILDVSQSTDDNEETVSHYLVKWCSLPYEDSTWELKQDIDQAKIEEFEKRMAREPKQMRVERPPSNDWQKSESSREYKNGNALREYQLEGVNWLLFNWYNTRNCILADEMGLGKTIQSITFLHEIFLKGIHSPFLIIAPLSTIPNWEREFHTWTDLNVIVYHGSQASRQMIQTYEMNFRDSQGRVIKGAYKFHAVITTFEMILTDCPELRNIQWRCVIIDEAHRLKNRNCKLLEGLKMMDMEHKVLLTGTPLQNTVEELFSLLNFLEPERFPSETTFMQEFGDLKTEEQGRVIKGAYKFHAVITTFEMILTDCPELRNIQWRCVIIDEAHRLKNRNCKLLEGLKMMDMEHKVLLTGTPLQNTVEELFSLLNFLEPERFPSETTFMQEFGDLKTEEQMQQLSKKEIEDLLRKGAYGALMDEEDEGSKFCEEDIDQILKRRTQTITIESEGKGSTFAKMQQLSKKEIEDLLRKGAYGALMDEEDEGSKFCEEDIDQILKRRTQTITIESEGKGSTFAKASFVAAGNRTDISLEDPDFWQKWAKKAELDMEAIHGRNNLVIDTPRIRKQTRHFSSIKEEDMMEFSELESDSEEKPSLKPRRPQDKSQGYPRSECFRVEKNLLVYGWGRWIDILSHGRFKRQLTEQDVETICRAVLVYCLNHYKGDENIKSFIWDLITPTEDGQTRALQNHSGLSAPVPRGRKGKKVKTQSAQPVLQKAVLLRVRMLYYLMQEVISDQADSILEGTDSSEIDIWIPQPFHAELPADWWDKEADKSLLIGVFKHGYEKYNSMRADPALYFLERVGMPDAKAIAAEQRGADMMADGADGGDFDREDEDPEYKPARMPFKDEMDEFANSPLDDKEESMDAENAGKSGENAEFGKLYWPSASALTTRLRRLITAYQRCYKREQMRQEAMTKTDRRRRRPREEVRALEAEREAIITERRQKVLLRVRMLYYLMQEVISDQADSILEGTDSRWTRREEADFYRVVSTFGVMYDANKQQFDWNQFRAFARLDKKTDDSLEKYFYSFVAMCRRVCQPPDPTIIIDPITEERASRTLYRIELMRKIREQVLPHPELEERLKLCQASLDLPEWWESGRHDKDLLMGACKHGVSRTDYHILNDPELSFLEAHKNFAQNKSSGQFSSTPLLSQTPLLAPSTPASQSKKEEDQDQTIKPEGAEVLELDENKTEVGSPKAKEEEEKGNEEKASNGEGAFAEDSKSAPEKVTCETETAPESPEALTELGPKSISEKGSEEDEDKMDDDKSEESSQAEAGVASQGKNFDEESNASLSTARDETRDGFYAEDGETSMAQILQERSYSFSFWPKDRVMINRLDNVCETVVKGKWPVNRRQLFDFPGLLPGYTPSAMDSPLQRRSFAELSMVGQASYSGSEDIAQSPQISKARLKCSDQEDALSMPVPRQRRRRRRKIEIEAERAVKRRNLMEMVAQLRESHVASESHDKAVDLSQAFREATGSTSNLSAVASKFLLPNASTPTPDAFKTQLELLQAGFSGTPTRHLMNGSILDGDLPMKRRRGRRKNVEGLDLLFLANKRASLSAEDVEVTKAFVEGVQTPPQPLRNIPSPGQLDPNAHIPVINLEDGTRLVGEDAPQNKDLVEWLKQHPTYTVDMPSYLPKNEDLLLSPFQKPKQKRHRCRNPNKIDINTLTGEERVPVVNRRNGKKVGGAMAPPMKDLPRWLEENPEFVIAPDWTDIVKQSGFLPESMFDRLLTGPVMREEGSGRRGRRPKSEIAKAAAHAAAAAAAAATASSSGINPLLMNSLFAGMDLTSLQNLQNLQSLQLAGLMGFPSGLATASVGGTGDAKHAAAMLPLMLPGMAGLPNMFGLGGLFNNNLAAAAVAASSTASTAGQGETEDGTSKIEEKEDEDCEDQESDKSCLVSGETNSDISAAAAAATAAAAAMSTNPLAFNPFLLSTMAPGLFYPSMFLPPSLGGLSLHGFSQATLAGLQNAMGGSGRSEDKEDKEADTDANLGTKEDDGVNALEDSDTDESQNKTADSSVLEDELGPGEELDLLDGAEEVEEDVNDE